MNHKLIGLKRSALELWKAKNSKTKNFNKFYSKNVSLLIFRVNDSLSQIRKLVPQEKQGLKYSIKLKFLKIIFPTE